MYFLRVKAWGFPTKNQYLINQAEPITAPRRSLFINAHLSDLDGIEQFLKLEFTWAGIGKKPQAVLFKSDCSNMSNDIENPLFLLFEIQI
jgi:hypothetical protein